MNTNIEIKAKARDFLGLKTLAQQLSDTPGEQIDQEDTFFHAPKGRLKLRVFSPDRAELIYYERNDQTSAKQSQYLIARTNDPSAMKAALAAALGICGVVCKRRYLYLCGQTRIHLDKVEGLGDFMELEVVMQVGQSIEEGSKIANALMEKLEIRKEDLIAGAYIDLLLSG